MKKILLFWLGFTACVLSQSAVVEKMDQMMNEYAAQDLFSGIVLVAHRGEPIFQKAVGYADKSRQIPHQIDTQLKIGSIVKDFTAVVILQLAEQGQLKLDDPIGKYLDDFPREVLETVTIRHLLRHEAGFGDYLMNPGVIEKLDELKTVQDILDLFKDEPLLFAPGTEERYSNSGYAVLGAVIEKVTGKSYAEAVEERILQPLGMTDTYFDWKKIAAMPQRPQYYLQSATGKHRPVPFHEWPSPSGGAYSTVGDLLKFETSLLQDHRLLSEASKTRKENRFAEGGEPWNQIIADSATAFGKAGGSPGSNAVILSLPAWGYVIIALANYDEPIAEIVAKQLYNILKNGRYDPPRPPIFQQLYQTYQKQGGEYLQAHFQEIISGYPLLDPPDFLLNRVGYDLLNENEMDAAIEIFEINTRLFPEIANTWDSLGEAHMRKGNRELAIRYYRKSLQLDPHNRNAERMLEQLEATENE